jgi:hypothetical protein
MDVLKRTTIEHYFGATLIGTAKSQDRVAAIANGFVNNQRPGAGGRRRLSEVAGLP